MKLGSSRSACVFLLAFFVTLEFLSAQVSSSKISSSLAATHTPRQATNLAAGFDAIPGAKLTNLNSSKGLPNDNVSCVVPDAIGNVYFTTGFAKVGGDNEALPGAGAVIWNHRQFTSITTGLPSLTVQACAYDPATASVWFGSTAGVAKYLPANGSITNFLAGQEVQDIIVRGADIWVAADAGVFTLNASSGALMGSYSLGARATSLTFDTGGTLWAGTANGLYRFSGNQFAAQSTPFPTPYIQDVEADASGNVWVTLWHNSVWRKSRSGTFTAFPFGPTVAGIHRVYTIKADPSGNLWFTHGNFGANPPAAAASFLPAAQVNSATPAFRSYSVANSGLPINSAFTTGFEAGAVWFGSAGGGAWRAGGPFDAPGFPQQLAGQAFYNSPLLVDLDNDRKLEVVVGDNSGRVYAFKSDGSQLWVTDIRTAILPIQRSGLTVGGLPGNPVIHSSAAAGDVDGDGEIEIVIGVGGLINSETRNGQGGIAILSRLGVPERFLYTYDTRGLTGTPVGPGLAPKQDGLTEGVYATPVLGNVDGDPELEIFAGALDNQFHGWNFDGTPVSASDIDNDGRYGEDGLGDSTPLTFLDPSDDAPGIKGVDDNGDGIVDNGFTNSDDDEDNRIDEDYPEWPFPARDTILTSATVWDIDGDGQKEIIFGHDYSGGSNQEFARGGVLRVLNSRGAQVPGFPKGNLEQVIWSSPAVVDLDGDGSYEIIHGTGPELETAGNTPADLLIGQLVYAWRANGSPFVASNANGRLATTEGRTFASFTVGDLNNDGSPELVITTQGLNDRTGALIDAAGNRLATDSAGNLLNQAAAVGQRLYVFRADGTVWPGFPVRTVPLSANASVTGSPILADVNGDNILDIVVPAHKGVLVFDLNGRALPGMGSFENFQEDAGPWQITGSPAIADLDNDGLMEMVWTHPSEDNITSRLRVVKLGTHNIATYQKSWPQWRRTVNRNGVFGPVISVVQGYESGASLNVVAQAFSGRNPLTEVSANLTAIGGPANAAMAVQPNSYYSLTHNIGAVAPGRYLIPVTIRDMLNRVDSQTLIFIKRAGTNQLAISAAALDFGATNQGQSVSRQVTVLNLGSAPVTVGLVVTNSPEFVASVENNPVGVVFPWTGLQLPLTLQPGNSTSFQVRFRPNAGSGVRTAALTVNSNGSPAANTAALSGSTFTGNAGCAVTATVSSMSILSPGESSRFDISTAPANCAWTATSSARWLSVFPQSGRGNAGIFWTAFPNLTVQVRTARININGTVFTVTQQQSILSEDQRFVADLYFAFLGRYPTDAELAFHLGNLPATGRTGLASNFLNSAEFNLVGRFVAGLYVGILNRDAEYAGWLFQRNAVATGFTTPAALVGAFINSAEFQLNNAGINNDNFVRLLYRQILLREPAPAEVAFQSATLSDAQSRINLATNFLNSPEFRITTGPRLTAFLLYALLLQRDPSPSELQTLVSRIGSGTPATVPISELLASYEFLRIVL